MGAAMTFGQQDRQWLAGQFSLSIAKDGLALGVDQRDDSGGIDHEQSAGRGFYDQSKPFIGLFQCGRVGQARVGLGVRCPLAGLLWSREWWHTSTQEHAVAMAKPRSLAGGSDSAAAQGC